jgi:hypothetical protein
MATIFTPHGQGFDDDGGDQTGDVKIPLVAGIRQCLIEHRNVEPLMSAGRTKGADHTCLRQQ